MIVHIQKDLDPNLRSGLENKIRSLGYKPSYVVTQYRDCIVCTGSNEFDIREIGNLPGVVDVHRVPTQYKLVSSKWRVESTSVELGDDVVIGRSGLSVMAGPCSVESVEHAVETIAHLKENGIKIMRTMVFKPRSSPYAFRGLGIDGLKEIAAVCRREGIKILSEVMQVSQVDEMYDYVDIFQVGARNTQNFNLLDALGKVDKPVLIKRGMSGTIDELLQSAEYVFSNGNEKIILCERGIRTFENAYRNTFDLNAIPILKSKSHLPVVADPSHAIGIRMHVAPMAYAAVMAGADGIVVEVHKNPSKAFSDGQQTLDFNEARSFYENLEELNKTRTRLKPLIA